MRGRSLELSAAISNVCSQGNDHQRWPSSISMLVGITASRMSPTEVHSIMETLILWFHGGFELLSDSDLIESQFRTLRCGTKHPDFQNVIQTSALRFSRNGYWPTPLQIHCISVPYILRCSRPGNTTASQECSRVGGVTTKGSCFASFSSSLGRIRQETTFTASSQL